MYAAAPGLQGLLLLGNLYGVCEAEKIHLMACTKILELLKGTYPFTLVGWVRKTVRQEKYLHDRRCQLPFSWKPTYDVRTYPGACTQWHSAPQLARSGTCRICWREIRRALSLKHAYLVFERMHLHIPCRFKAIRASILLSSAKIEVPDS